MGIYNLYSKRKNLAERGNQPDVYQYTDLPVEFRRQVIHIWISAIGLYCEPRFGSVPLVNHLWDTIHNSIARELGRFYLGGELQNPFEQCKSFLLDKDTPIEHLLDLIELTFNKIEKVIPQILQHYQYQGELNNPQLAEDAIGELNHRFREHAIGYQYTNGQIIRVDSGFIHAEVVVPALSLLSSQDFKGAEQEFRSAHEHYRKEEYKDAIVDALKAFESAMKTICEECGWYCDKGAGAKELINVVLKNGLVPEYLQTHLSGLRSVLEAGVPTVRNKTSGHGQGSQPTSVPEYLAAYVLHLTASNIVLLIEAYKAKQSGST
ncbi:MULTISPECIES: STM4504/CBY_0614 family protein [unclassified Microcoleus]|uniref:STM4504/CBY_0614 family protein n=1 Tax=unclassified Microcoleus TaxID=2642155 RepID=UPI002FD358CE